MLNLQAVVDSVKKRKQGDRSKHIGLFVCGGNARGAYNAGNFLELHQQGLMDCLDVVFGQSAGSVVTAYALAGPEQTEIGSSIFYEEMASEKYFDLGRQEKQLDIDYIKEVISYSNSPKRINRDKILSCRQLFYTVCQTTKGQIRIFDSKTVSIFPHLYASIAYPGLYNGVERINGEECRDCSITKYPFKEIMETIKGLPITDFLILENWPEETDEKKYTLREEARLVEILAKKNPIVLKEVVASDRINKEQLEYIKNLSGINFGIVYPKRVFSKTFTTDPDLAKYSINEGRRMIQELFF